jgi:hypothetical protein
MRREVIPWKTPGELADLLDLESRLLASYAAALREGRDPASESERAAILLCRYLVEGSAHRACDWANAMGWKKSSSKRGVASLVMYTAAHIYGFIDNPPPGLSPELVAVCRLVYKRQRLGQ